MLPEKNLQALVAEGTAKMGSIGPVSAGPAPVSGPAPTQGKKEEPKKEEAKKPAPAPAKKESTSDPGEGFDSFFD